MASVSQKTLLSSQNFTADGQSSSFALDNNATDLVGVLDVTFNSGTSTCDVDIETSSDETNWHTLISFTQVTTTSATEALSVGASATLRHALTFVRANVDVGAAGSPDYDVTCQLYFRRADG